MTRVGVAVLLFAGVAMAAVAGARASSRPLTTALVAPGVDLTKPAEIQKITAAGVTAIRLPVDWADIAPTVASSEFAAADPADPGYRWAAVDAAVQAAVDAGLEPILDITDAPAWAQKGPPKQYYGPVRP